MDTRTEVLKFVDAILGLKGRGLTFGDDTALLGAIPELDSMAVASMLTGMEERFGFTVDDDEIDGSVFETVGSLVAFVATKLS